MCVDHGRLGAVVAQQFLYVPDISTCLKQMGGKTMAKEVKSNIFFYSLFLISNFIMISVWSSFPSLKACVPDFMKPWFS